MLLKWFSHKKIAAEVLLSNSHKTPGFLPSFLPSPIPACFRPDSSSSPKTHSQPLLPPFYKNKTLLEIHPSSSFPSPLPPEKSEMKARIFNDVLSTFSSPLLSVSHSFFLSFSLLSKSSSYLFGEKRALQYSLT